VRRREPTDDDASPLLDLHTYNLVPGDRRRFDQILRGGGLSMLDRPTGSELSTTARRSPTDNRYLGRSDMRVYSSMRSISPGYLGSSTGCLLTSDA
jgi:hypothetical protein